MLLYLVLQTVNIFVFCQAARSVERQSSDIDFSRVSFQRNAGVELIFFCLRNPLMMPSPSRDPFVRYFELF